ncbi:Uncharacterized protein BP5553_08300 [Venustampulla echinocandica]|uniref:DUF6594 domain-containing protein n=1 Tax=Venustampulla echinocandica TaxID=2656787 RepID=A0A370TGA9_9HELO|nr:Uncharacterized protein BP5553_08300 [Venustampulla echinocandica]RDL33932.1 Uncharacterized protein BP5553_08300 [Venustampulla echinocandica]
MSIETPTASVELPSVVSTAPSSPPPTRRTSTSIRSVTTTEGPRLTEEEIEKKPWKYIGYKGYSEFIASDNDFYIVRKFASLNTRIALALQDQIAVLEADLNELDAQYSQMDAEDLHNGSFRDDREDRTELVEKIATKVAKYNEFILQQIEFKKYPQPFRQDLKSLRNWHHNHDNVAIATDEQAYLTHTQDLISVIPKEKTPLRRLLERSRKFRILPLWMQKTGPELPIYDKDVITYTSDKRIDRFITVVVVGIGSVMLIAPMWILQAMPNSRYKLAVITTFIVAFLGMVSYTTIAKPFETLAATAA